MQVDLRSDTVTRPTADMRRAMAAADVGDDEYGEDPTVRLLQERFAELTGKQEAMFVPSGTMANQVALRCLTRPGDAVVTGRHQHVLLYEEGAGPINSGISFLPVADPLGTLEPAEVQQVIAAGDHHQPAVRLITVEDTHMAAGGRVWPMDQIDSLARLARSEGVPIHLDGARLWNASVASGVTPAARAAHATTVMACLSKGLGAPVGSLLAGPTELMDEARLARKRFGGTMRQSGVIAAAGLVALGRIDRLAEDHDKARRLALAVAERWPESGLDPASVETNIVIFSYPDPAGLLRHLADGGLAAGTVGPGRVRLVTHADVDTAGIDLACALIAKAP